MDPSLQELLNEATDPEQELEALMRLVLPGHVPDKVKVIASFGDVITCRIRRKDIEEVYNSPLKFSLKASKYFSGDILPVSVEPKSSQRIGVNSNNNGTRRAAVEKQKVILGVVDWGCDFTHPDFLNRDGSTRLIGIWDQSANSANGTIPYGYGLFFPRQQINDALKTSEPFKVLGYHPSKSDSAGIGAHGTHVMGIAAGNGRTGPPGIAPEAELAFVHLSAGDTTSSASLGDSVRILEAIDFLRNLAGDSPLVINLSVGRHGGPHDGNTLVERAIDNFLNDRKNTMVCQSTGNYYKSNTHAAGMVRPGKKVKIKFRISEADTTPNELEVWYSGKDAFDFILQKNEIMTQAGPGETQDILFRGELIGRVYHRLRDPVNLKNHINVFLYTNAPAGEWEFSLAGIKITDGRFDAWIERDSGCKNCQARFIDDYIVYAATTGTICNGFHSIVAGAYNTHTKEFEIGAFSSQGPTTDGRYKPDLLAPGVKITAAKSASAKQSSSGGELTVMSGTSMAAPHVSGTAARVLELLPPGTPFYVIKNIICGSTDKVNVSDGQLHRIGNGLLNVRRALQYASVYRNSVMAKTSVAVN